MRANPTSVSFQVAVFFAANPDEVLTVKDIADKTGHSASSVQKAMRQAKDQGLVVVDHERIGGVDVNMYRPGPTLLKMRGLA